jgi:hypothetical protein
MSSNSNFCVDLIDLEALAERYHVFAIGFIEDAVKGIVNEKPLAVFSMPREPGALRILASNVVDLSCRRHRLQETAGLRFLALDLSPHLKDRRKISLCLQKRKEAQSKLSQL